MLGAFNVTTRPRLQKSKLSLCAFTYLLTPRSRVLLEKPTGCQIVKKSPQFYRTLHYRIYKSRPPIATPNQIYSVHTHHPTF